MNPLLHEDCGEAVEQTRGTSAHRATITDAITTLSPRHKRIAYPGRQIFPQHCQVPFLSMSDHMRELTNDVVSMLKNMTAEKQLIVLALFRLKLSDAMVQPEGPAFLTSPVRMSDCVQGIEPFECKGKGHRFQRLGW